MTLWLYILQLWKFDSEINFLFVLDDICELYMLFCCIQLNFDVKLEFFVFKTLIVPLRSIHSIYQVMVECWKSNYIYMLSKK